MQRYIFVKWIIGKKFVQSWLFRLLIWQILVSYQVNDFVNQSSVNLNFEGLHNGETPTLATVERVANELDKALSSVGFVYLKNHGISQHLVSCFRLLIQLLDYRHES